MPNPNDLADDDLMTLTEACDLFFRGHLTKSSLRTEAARGNLEIIRIANKDFVTRNGIRRMIEKCSLTVPVQRPVDGISSKLAAKEKLRALKASLSKPTLKDLGSTGDLSADKAFHSLVAMAVAADEERKARRKRRTS